MTVFKNVIAAVSKSKNVYIDAFLPKGRDFDIAVFFHGTKGFKDWGAWPFMAPYFNNENIGLVNVSFSHNGIATAGSDQMDDIPAYSANTISLELSEMKMVLDFLDSKAEEWGHQSRYSIIGHSRAGAEVIIYANRDERVNKVICWAPVGNFLDVYREFDPEKWKTDGSVITVNARTGQEMPVNYTFYTDIEKNKTEFDIMRSASLLMTPLLLLHGDADQAVSIKSSEAIYEQCLHSIFVPVQNGDHTFGLKHPWSDQQKFPHTFSFVLENTIDFILG